MTVLEDGEILVVKRKKTVTEKVTVKKKAATPPKVKVPVIKNIKTYIST